MKVLLLVDLQNDFLTGGTMPVPQGEAIIPIANQLEGCFKLVVATQDWHPANHKSFAPNHPGRQPGEVVVLKKRPQRLWPTHCVQSTRGSELAASLMQAPQDLQPLLNELIQPSLPASAPSARK